MTIKSGSSDTALSGRLKIEPIHEINWPCSIQAKRKPLLLVDHEMNLADSNSLLHPKKDPTNGRFQVFGKEIFYTGF